MIKLKLLGVHAYGFGSQSGAKRTAQKCNNSGLSTVKVKLIFNQNFTDMIPFIRYTPNFCPFLKSLRFNGPPCPSFIEF